MNARVVLRGCESYTFNKKTWLKDVPQIVKGEDTIKQFEANGYFLVKRLPSPQSEQRKAPEANPKKFVKRTLPETRDENEGDGDGDHSDSEDGDEGDIDE